MCPDPTRLLTVSPGPPARVSHRSSGAPRWNIVCHGCHVPRSQEQAGAQKPLAYVFRNMQFTVHLRTNTEPKCRQSEEWGVKGKASSSKL